MAHQCHKTCGVRSRCAGCCHTLFCPSKNPRSHRVLHTTSQSLSISAFGLATVLFGISTPVLAMAGKLKYLNPGDPRCSRIITVAVVVLAVVAAVIPWVFGVVGPDDGGCWIDDNMNKTKLLEWQLGLFHLWLVLAWLGASFLFGYMMLGIYKSRLRVESEGWPSDIRCYLLLVIAVVRVVLYCS